MPYKKYQDENQYITIYKNYGYEAKIIQFISPLDNSPYLSVEVKCEYLNFHPYPIIKYNRALDSSPKRTTISSVGSSKELPTNTNQLEGIFNSFFVLTENNEQEWILGIQNAVNFIKEMNEVIEKDLQMDIKELQELQNIQEK
jgi:hypothetical protein